MKARQIRSDDLAAITDLVRSAGRIFLGMDLEYLPEHLFSAFGWLVEHQDQPAAFLLAEMRPFRLASIVGAAVANGESTSTCLDAMLPAVEGAVADAGAEAIVQIGHAPWLVDYLIQNGYQEREQVVTYRWKVRPIRVDGNQVVRIEPAQVEDLADVVVMDRQVFGPIWHKPATQLGQILDRSQAFFVAKMEDQLVGYQWSDRRERYGHLTRLAVGPDWEGKGIGTRLLTEALAELVEAGVEQVTVNTQASNQRSRALYERHGFEPVSQRIAVLWKALNSTGPDSNFDG